MSARKSVLAIYSVFFLESMVLGHWVPRIPDIKENLHLSDMELGLSLLALPLGTFIGLLVAAKSIEVVGGLRRGCQIFLPLWALSFALPPLASSQAVFSVYLIIAGVFLGLAEVIINTEADSIEQRCKTKIMSRCHGFWSLGSMAGALIGSLIAQVGIGVEWHFLVAMPLVAVAAYGVSTMLPSDTDAVASETTTSIISRPPKALVLLCVMPIGINMLEGAFIDWSAVFMRSVLEASPLLIGITYSFFAIVMAAVRLSGDWIGERCEPQLIVLVSGISACVGITVFSLAPNPTVAFIGAALSGMGVAIVYPTAVTAAARRPGRSPADNVASLAMISFTAFLVGPPLIGLLSEAFGLRVALLFLAPVTLITVVLSSQVRVRE